jgi:hypothetical protein
VFRDEDGDEDEDEKQEEPALHFEAIYFDAPYNNLGNSSEPVYEPNRKRVVRFLEDEEDPNEESMDRGFMMMDELAAAGGMAAAGMLASKANDALQESDASICMLDVFDEGESGVKSNNNSQHLDDSGTSMFAPVEDDDSSNNSLDEEEEQEKQIRKTLLMTMFGMGFMGLVGFGTKKLMNILSRDKDQDLGAGDIVGDGIDTATHAQGVSVGSSSQTAAQGSFNASTNASQTGSFSQTAAQGSFNASANASASSSQTSNAFAAAWVGNNPAAMTGAQ